ncbi:MAG: hypothetical protein IPK07_14460 [Deltaproteobacteria bacterium]|jgi:hypothetical protein|nr:hypothetical protein [Deltaproteobacteria bacterium]
MTSFLIMLGVAMIDAKLWTVVLEQRRHNRAVEALLADLRDRVPNASIAPVTAHGAESDAPTAARG